MEDITRTKNETVGFNSEVEVSVGGKATAFPVSISISLTLSDSSISKSVNVSKPDGMDDDDWKACHKEVLEAAEAAADGLLVDEAYGDDPKISTEAQLAVRRMVAAKRKGDDWNPNPWAVCNTSVGTRKTKKRERCIQRVKERQASNRTASNATNEAFYALLAGMRRDEVASRYQLQPADWAEIRQMAVAAGARDIEDAVARTSCDQLPMAFRDLCLKLKKTRTAQSVEDRLNVAKRWNDNLLKTAAGKDFVEITCRIGGSDAKLFTDVVNQGIDSYLEAFTKSRFGNSGDRLVLNFHRDELPLLVRRLEEINSPDAAAWAEDIRGLPEYPAGETGSATAVGFSINKVVRQG